MIIKKNSSNNRLNKEKKKERKKLSHSHMWFVSVSHDLIVQRGNEKKAIYVKIRSLLTYNYITIRTYNSLGNIEKKR